MSSSWEKPSILSAPSSLPAPASLSSSPEPASNSTVDGFEPMAVPLRAFGFHSPWKTVLSMPWQLTAMLMPVVLLLKIGPASSTSSAAHGVAEERQTVAAAGRDRRDAAQATDGHRSPAVASRRAVAELPREVFTPSCDAVGRAG